MCVCVCVCVCVYICIYMRFNYMNTHIKGTLLFDSIPHGHHHVIHVLHL